MKKAFKVLCPLVFLFFVLIFSQRQIVIAGEVYTRVDCYYIGDLEADPFTPVGPYICIPEPCEKTSYQKAKSGATSHQCNAVGGGS